MFPRAHVGLSRGPKLVQNGVDTSPVGTGSLSYRFIRSYPHIMNLTASFHFCATVRRKKGRGKKKKERPSSRTLHAFECPASPGQPVSTSAGAVHQLPTTSVAEVFRVVLEIRAQRTERIACCTESMHPKVIVVG